VVEETIMAVVAEEGSSGILMAEVTLVVAVAVVVAM
jgi:hypothetical protein